MFSIFWNKLFQESQMGLSAERIHRGNHKLLASSSPSHRTQQRSAWWLHSVELDLNFLKQGLRWLSGSRVFASLTALHQHPTWFPVSPAAVGVGSQWAAPFLQHGEQLWGWTRPPGVCTNFPVLPTARGAALCSLGHVSPRSAACSLPCPCASRGCSRAGWSRGWPRPGAVGFWQVSDPLIKAPAGGK